MKKNTVLLCILMICFCLLPAESKYGTLKSRDELQTESASAVGEATGGRYRFIDDDADSNFATAEVTTRTYLYAGMNPVSVTEGNQTLNITTDIRGSVRALTDRYGMTLSACDYDEFGIPLSDGTAALCGLGYAGKPYDAVTGLQNYGFRDYNPRAGRFTTMDPIRWGQNWYAYVDNDPINSIDVWGLAPRNMTEKNRSDYKQKVTEYAVYKLEGDRLDIPDVYDCADVATFLYGQATAETTLGNQSGTLLHGETPIGANVSYIQSEDYFTEQTKNITYYDDRSFNNENVEVGTVMVWEGPGLEAEKGWVGHVATVVDVQRDKQGNVTEIKIIQGHTGGNRTEVVTIPNQTDLNSYAGNFLGFGEIGENSTTPIMEIIQSIIDRNEKSLKNK